MVTQNFLYTFLQHSDIIM